MANLLTGRWRIDRRVFLRGTGVALALPLLDVMATTARAVGATRPARLAFIYVPNGVNMKAWTPKGDGTDYELSPSLGPLAKLRSEVTVFTGLHHPNSFGAGHTVGDTWLTGAKLNGTPGRDYANSLSADQMAAEFFGAATRFPSLELSISGGTGKPGNLATLAISRAGTPLPAESSPRVAFDRLFGQSPNGAAAEHRRVRRHQSLLDAVGKDAKQLSTQLGSADRSKLDEYLASVRETEIRVKRAEEWLEVPKPKVDGAEFQKRIPADALKDYFRVIYDLMVLAFQTDSTRAITYQAGQETTGLTFAEIGVHQLQHSLSHHQNDPANLAALAKIDAFQVEQFAYFIEKLKSIPEGDGKLLDRTLVLYGSGMSNGNAHAVVNLPTLLAGGRGLEVKQGQHINFNKNASEKAIPGEAGQKHSEVVNPNARLSNLLLTMLHKAGVRADSFSDSVAEVAELSG